MNKTERQIYYQSLLSSHQSYWLQKKDKLESYMRVYTSEFWEGKEDTFQEFERKVETPHGYNIIEQYITALYEKNPAIALGSDPLNDKDVESIEAIVNRWLPSNRSSMENSTKLSLIFGSGFVHFFANQKLIADDNPQSYLEAPQTEALRPEEVLVDTESSSWETQRFVGRVSQIPLGQVASRFSRSSLPKGLNPKPFDFYFDRDGAKDSELSAYSQSDDSTPSSHKYINVVEFYDLIDDTLTIWTPDHDSGYYEFVHSTIPVRSDNDQPLVPIFPLIFSSRPDKPMIGLSTMARIYPLIKEKNDLRTHRANAIRSNTRKYLLDKTFLSDQFAELLQTPVDGLYIPVDIPNGKHLTESIYAIPIQTLGSDFDQYTQEIDADLATSTLFAPFARGEVTKATATEVGVLSQYTASEQGKMERTKNECLERLAKYYVRWLALQLDDDVKITIEGAAPNKEAEIISGQSFSGKFRYAAADEATTPLAAAIRKQQLIELIPLLLNLGASPEKLREELINKFGLPITLNEQPKMPANPQTPDLNQQQPPIEIPGVPV